MKRMIIVSLLALSLSACVSAKPETTAAEKINPPVEPVVECAIFAPNGNCSCLKTDDNGDCVEGGGIGTANSGGTGPQIALDSTSIECAIVAPDGTCACTKVDDNGDCVEGGGIGTANSGGTGPQN